MSSSPIDRSPQGKSIDMGTWKANIRDKRIRILYQPWSVYSVCFLAELTAKAGLSENLEEPS